MTIKCCLIAKLLLAGILMVICSLKPISSQTYSWSYTYGPTRNGYRSTHTGTSSHHVSAPRPIVPGRTYYYNYPPTANSHFVPVLGHFPLLPSILQPSHLLRPNMINEYPYNGGVLPGPSSSVISSSSSAFNSAPYNPNPVSSLESATNSLNRPSNSLSPATVGRPSIRRRPVTSTFVSRPRPSLAGPSPVVPNRPTPAPAPVPSTPNDADVGFDPPSSGSDSASLGGPTVTDNNSPSSVRNPPSVAAPATNGRSSDSQPSAVDPSGFSSASSR